MDLVILQMQLLVHFDVQILCHSHMLGIKLISSGKELIFNPLQF